MAIRDIFKISRKTFLNPTAWFDIENLKAQNQTIVEAVKGLTLRPAPLREESYEEALERLGLTDKEAQERAKLYKLYALIFLLCGIVTFVYTLYILFFHLTFSGLILGLGATALFLSQAFQYDFWAFEITSRQLGRSYRDWKNHLIGKKAG